MKPDHPSDCHCRRCQVNGFGAFRKPVTLAATVEVLTQQLAAEKLRADTLATYLGEHAYVINCGSCIMLVERTPEEWAELARKEQL